MVLVDAWLDTHDGLELNYDSLQSSLSLNELLAHFFSFDIIAPATANSH